MRPGRRAPQLGVHAATLLLLMAAAALGPCGTRGQEQMPFLGNGDFAPSVSGEAVDVHTSVFIDRMLKIDDKEYEVVLWIYLSWRDARVKGQIEEAYEKMVASNTTYVCQYPCQSTGKARPGPLATRACATAGGCCDEVWQPYIAITNIRWLPQDRVMRYAFGWNPDGDNVWYWRSVHAVYYTSMDLRAYPFDHQTLLVQMEVPQSGALVNLIPSVTGNAMFTARTGQDQVSGWGVRGVRLSPFSFALCHKPLDFANMPSDPADPSPLAPRYLYDLRKSARAADQCENVISRLPHPSDSVYWRTALIAGIRGKPVIVSGLNVHIRVARFWAPVIITAIFPIVATTWLAFLVFFLPRKDMEARLGAVTGLFLALAAIQFVITGSTPASSYVTALQGLVLASYVTLILVGLENVFLWWLTVYHKNKEQARLHKRAEREYAERLLAVRSALDTWLQRSHDHAAAAAAAATAAASDAAPAGGGRPLSAAGGPLQSVGSATGGGGAAAAAPAVAEGGGAAAAAPAVAGGAGAAAAAPAVAEGAGAAAPAPAARGAGGGGAAPVPRSGSSGGGGAAAVRAASFGAAPSAGSRPGSAAEMRRVIDQMMAAQAAPGGSGGGGGGGSAGARPDPSGGGASAAGAAAAPAKAAPAAAPTAAPASAAAAPASAAGGPVGEGRQPPQEGRGSGGAGVSAGGSGGGGLGRSSAETFAVLEAAAAVMGAAAATSAAAAAGSAPGGSGSFTSRPRGGGGGGGGARKAPPVKRGESKFSALPWWRRAPARWLHHWRLFQQTIKDDPAYADAVAHRRAYLGPRPGYAWNKWLALIQFLAYNISVVVIFAAASADQRARQRAAGE
ncbi:MAG: hypothetical protein J3K34DRAFT_523004 [Monoraphidium minutum]|nr:MAG: hypothetical protein J3K34DRAFT_523004 [Monoraphidium minutum]